MGARAQHSPAYRQLTRLLLSWRQEAGLTQRALAEKLRRPASYVAKSESGERRMDPVEMIRWCRACGVKPAEGMKALEAGV